MIEMLMAFLSGLFITSAYYTITTEREKILKGKRDIWMDKAELYELLEKAQDDPEKIAEIITKLYLSKENFRQELIRVKIILDQERAAVKKQEAE